ncbi:hypothetical protein [Candidatus Nitrosotenuis aquarius]|uniref:hypothetical protein n=1 Tax=Candidatus Nitrosotenuis aquarius TaxID=1846278 RepID=UPI000C1E379D|nr:hypothetical protein [Candidatus Nitrosotenuis aquarius]
MNRYKLNPNWIGFAAVLTTIYFVIMLVLPQITGYPKLSNEDVQTILGGSGIVLGLVIFIIQAYQSKEIEIINKELRDLLDVKRRVYANAILGWLWLVVEQKDSLLNAHNGTTPINFVNDQAKKNFIVSEYKRLLQDLKPAKLQFDDLVGVFKEDVLEPYGKLEKMCRISITQFPSTIDNIVNEFNKGFELVLETKKALLPYASDEIRKLFD